MLVERSFRRPKTNRIRPLSLGSASSLIQAVWLSLANRVPTPPVPDQLTSPMSRIAPIALVLVAAITMDKLESVSTIVELFDSLVLFPKKYC